MIDENDKDTIDAFHAPMVFCHYTAVADLTAYKVRGFAHSKTPPSIRDLYETPGWMFNYFSNMVGGFAIDAAASERNAKCETFYTEEDDCLSFDWPVGPEIWCNPPFSNMMPFVDHIVEQAAVGCRIMMVCNNDISTAWYIKCIKTAADVFHFVSDGKNTGRVAFINSITGEPVTGNNKGSSVFYFRPHRGAIKEHYLVRSEIENLG